MYTTVETCGRLAKGGRARVQEKYTLEHMVEATVAVYQVAQERLTGKKSPKAVFCEASSSLC